MITGKAKISLGASLLLWAISLPAMSWQLDGLLSELAAQPHSDLRYLEQRHDTMLGVPLRTEGMLRYRAPDYLEKTIDRGGEGRFVIEGEQLRVQRGERLHDVALDSHPLLLAMATALRATLAGDRAALEAHFSLQLQGAREDWQLSLRPRQREVAWVLRELRILGSGAQILRIETEERSGDLTVTELRHGDAE
jgi:hypothetical protein